MPPARWLLPATLECVRASPPGTHPVLLLGLQLPHALQEPGLGPAQVCSEACDGDNVGLQLRCRDVYVHLRGDGNRAEYVGGLRDGMCPFGPQ